MANKRYIIIIIINLHVPIYRSDYGVLSPCGHLAMTDTPIIRTAAKSPTKIEYRRLTKINSRYYRLLLLRTLTRGVPRVSAIRGVKCSRLNRMGQFIRYNFVGWFLFLSVQCKVNIGPIQKIGIKYCHRFL